MTEDRFAQLIEEHHRPLLAYARAVSGDPGKAREIVQDAFVDAWRNVSRFDVTKDFAAWLRGIVRNKWRESSRRFKRELLLPDPDLARMEDAINQWNAAAGETGILARLRECREKLPPALSNAVTAYYDNEQRGNEAASCLSIHPATLRKRLERARAALRQCLENQS